MSKKTSITFKNYHVPFIVEWLNTPLHGKESRARNHFIKPFIERAKELEEDRVSILTELSTKDSDGKPEIKDNNFQVSPDNIITLKKHMEERNSEDFVIDILDSNRSDVNCVKEIIVDMLASRLELNFESGKVYDEVCEVFESL